MHLVIGGDTYERIRDLRFAPEADVTGSTCPVSTFTCELASDEDLDVGGMVELRDELGNLWAKYWLTYADRRDAHTLMLTCESSTRVMDRVECRSRVYDGTLASYVISEIFRRSRVTYTLDSSFASATLHGYCPKQSARERLQWVCMAIGAYVRDCFADHVEILPISSDATAIPESDTYWRPQLTYGEYVTAVKATYYAYEQGVPSRTDDYVELDNGDIYIQTSAEVTLTNPAAPQVALENVVSMDKVTLVNSSNVDEILARMALSYFKRLTVNADVIDLAQYKPGERVYLYDGLTMVCGHIASCDFRFGLRARASIKLVSAEEVPYSTITLAYVWDNTRVGELSFRLPQGYGYEIDTTWLDRSYAAHRYVFRPSVDSVSGTVGTEDEEIEVACSPALDWYGGDLHMHAVDEAGMSDATLVIT